MAICCVASWLSPPKQDTFLDWSRTSPGPSRRPPISSFPCCKNIYLLVHADYHHQCKISLLLAHCNLQQGDYRPTMKEYGPFQKKCTHGSLIAIYVVDINHRNFLNNLNWRKQRGGAGSGYQQGDRVHLVCLKVGYWQRSTPKSSLHVLYRTVSAVGTTKTAVTSAKSQIEGNNLVERTADINRETGYTWFV